MRIDDHEWKSYEEFSPPIGVLCLFRRDGQTTTTRYREHIAPEENVCGLYWKLSGIGREQFAVMPWPIQQQMNCGMGSHFLGAIGGILGIGGQ